MSDQREPTIRVSVDLPASVHRRFDQACRYGARRVSMNRRLNELVALDLEGRCPPHVDSGQPRGSRRRTPAAE